MLNHNVDTLVADFNKGDEEAFKAIYNEYYEQICLFSTKITGNFQEGQDIACEAFIQLYKQHTSFQALHSIRSFLYTTARNRAFNYLKMRQRSLERNKSFVYLHQDNFLQNELVEAGVIKALYKAIGNLPPQCQTVMELTYFQGKKTAEIADLLGIAETTVRNHKATALKILKSFLSSQQITLLAVSIYAELAFSFN